jgi:transposase
MDPRSRRRTRRVHGAEFKAKVLAQCRESGASVAAVAQANGLNANLVRKWLEGRGLKRCGLDVDGGASGHPLVPAQRAVGRLQFVPVELAAPRQAVQPAVPGGKTSLCEPTHIHVELSQGGASLAVQWPASQAWQCAAWLGELAPKVLK